MRPGSSPPRGIRQKIAAGAVSSAAADLGAPFPSPVWLSTETDAGVPSTSPRPISKSLPAKFCPPMASTPASLGGRTNLPRRHQHRRSPNLLYASSPPPPLKRTCSISGATCMGKQSSSNLWNICALKKNIHPWRLYWSKSAAISKKPGGFWNKYVTPPRAYAGVTGAPLWFKPTMIFT